jgi:uncharacterized protein YjbJ (UPF0337 family)
MDWNEVEGNWKRVKGKVKETWGKLTDSDLTAIGGHREELEGKLQERYGYTKDRVRKEIDDWQRSIAFDLNRTGDATTDQIEAIRNDIQNLASTVSRIANEQLDRAQNKAVDATNQAEEVIRQNPLSAVAIAFGLGFVFGVFRGR